jgi:hypothetical protein
MKIWIACLFIVIVALLVATAHLSQAQSKSTAFDPVPSVPLPEGMSRIFDGKTLDGWVQIPEGGWGVKERAMASVGAGRGVICTGKSFGRYRVIFDIRHVSGQPDHQACVLVFCAGPVEGEKPADALAGIQFQVPNGGHWDYRKGHNNAGKEEFTALPHAKFDVRQWSRVELLVDPEKGTARMAVAQPVGAKAVEVLRFKDPTAGRKGPFALQMHNKGLFDEYANIAVEENAAEDVLITTR